MKGGSRHVIFLLGRGTKSGLRGGEVSSFRRENENGPRDRLRLLESHIPASNLLTRPRRACPAGEGVLLARCDCNIFPSAAPCIAMRLLRSLTCRARAGGVA